MKTSSYTPLILNRQSRLLVEDLIRRADAEYASVHNPNDAAAGIEQWCARNWLQRQLDCSETEQGLQLSPTGKE